MWWCVPEEKSRRSWRKTFESTSRLDWSPTSVPAKSASARSCRRQRRERFKDLSSETRPESWAVRSTHSSYFDELHRGVAAWIEQERAKLAESNAAGNRNERK